MKQYKNLELIEKAEIASKEILDAKRSNHHRDKFFPMLIDKLGLKVGAEVGVDKGGFSDHILRKTNIEKYYCVDTWQDDFGSDFRPEYFDKDGSKRYQQACDTLREFINAERAIMLQGTSVEGSKKVPDNSLDFCYIDGDHSLEGIYTDIYTWTPKMKVGGIIAGHDYKDGPNSGINDFFGTQLPYRIKTVVDDTARRYGRKLNIVGGRILSWWYVHNG